MFVYKRILSDICNSIMRKKYTNNEAMVMMMCRHRRGLLFV